MRQSTGAMRVNRAMKLISGDKQDWLYLFSMITGARCLPIPMHPRSIDQAEAKDIASCVLHSINANFGYTAECSQLSVSKLAIKSGLRATWVKLLHGRWCWVASADDDESELSLWEIKSDGRVQISARIYLDAPVMNGEVYCSDGAARCAITIGAKYVKRLH